MELRHYFKQWLALALLVASISKGFAQVADGAPPSALPSSKYILYWGKNQFDLVEETGYKLQRELSVEAFRQMILQTPKLWNGKELVKNFQFNIEGTSVSTNDYPDQLASLDARLSSKIISGNILTINNLPLSEGIEGSISLVLAQVKSSTDMLYGNSSQQPSNFRNETFTDKVVWGREDIYETADRDFFTVNEFWQSIRQEPAVEWKTYQKPLPLRCEIRLASKENATFGFVTELETTPYSSALENLEHYRYLIGPGAIVLLQLQTATQYDLLYRKVLYIVANDDPRLRLRRQRDQHELEIQWGQWKAFEKNLYLQRLTNPQGQSFLADPPQARNTTMSYSDDGQMEWGTTKPICRIDGEEVSSRVSFRLSVADSIVFHVSSDPYEGDTLVKFFNENALNIDYLLIDSIQVENFELPAMSFKIFFPQINNWLLMQNNFSNLEKLAGDTTLLKLQPPTITASELEFQFSLLEKSPATFSIFEPGGWMDFTQQATFSAGIQTIKVPRSNFRNKGKHIAFVNSKFGAVKLEFTLE